MDLETYLDGERQYPGASGALDLLHDYVLDHGAPLLEPAFLVEELRYLCRAHHAKAFCGPDTTVSKATRAAELAAAMAAITMAGVQRVLHDPLGPRRGVPKRRPLAFRTFKAAVLPRCGSAVRLDTGDFTVTMRFTVAWPLQHVANLVSQTGVGVLLQLVGGGMWASEPCAGLVERFGGKKTRNVLYIESHRHRVYTVTLDAKGVPVAEYTGTQTEGLERELGSVFGMFETRAATAECDGTLLFANDALDYDVLALVLMDDARLLRGLHFSDSVGERLELEHAGSATTCVLTNPTMSKWSRKLLDMSDLKYKPDARYSVLEFKTRSLSGVRELYRDLVYMYKTYVARIRVVRQEYVAHGLAVDTPPERRQGVYLSADIRGVAPDCFPSQHSHMVRDSRHVQVVVGLETRSAMEEYVRQRPANTCIVFPPDAWGSGGAQQRVYTSCQNAEFPYIGLVSNTLQNRKALPYLPCCFQTPQGAKVESIIESVASEFVWDPSETIKVQVRNVLLTAKPVGVGVYSPLGLWDTALCTQATGYYRTGTTSRHYLANSRGVVRDPSIRFAVDHSLLECLAIALGMLHGVLGVGKRVALLRALAVAIADLGLDAEAAGDLAAFFGVTLAVLRAGGGVEVNRGPGAEPAVVVVDTGDNHELVVLRTGAAEFVGLLSASVVEEFEGIERRRVSESEALAVSYSLCEPAALTRDVLMDGVLAMLVGRFCRETPLDVDLLWDDVERFCERNVTVCKRAGADLAALVADNCGPVRVTSGEVQAEIRREVKALVRRVCRTCLPSGMQFRALYERFGATPLVCDWYGSESRMRPLKRVKIA